ncbi:MAG: dTDP-4-dehydrorhamnose reductase [Microbacteriaceae bacterium]|nr:dTDP-4-dehydrorhamnose reductase [Microbacteriaceae bacterium]
MSAPILVTGGGGMLAHALGKVFGDEVELVARDLLDITDPSAVTHAVRGRRAVINSAAYTAVDNAESHESDAFAVNARGAENIARACADASVALIHVSTDYVFDGRATHPYSEDSPTGPICAYGRSKLAGERAVVTAHPAGTRILRTAWLYGASGPNLVATMLAKARAGERVSVVTDQVGQPTWTVDVANRIRHVLVAPPGIYHATNAGFCSWWDLAVAVYDSAGADVSLVEKTVAAAFVRPTPRPSYSVLGDEAAHGVGLPAMRPWRDALNDALRTDFAV